jgi:hypothetical protein
VEVPDFFARIGLELQHFGLLGDPFFASEVSSWLSWLSVCQHQKYHLGGNAVQIGLGNRL